MHLLGVQVCQVEWRWLLRVKREILWDHDCVPMLSSYRLRNCCRDWYVMGYLCKSKLRQFLAEEDSSKSPIETTSSPGLVSWESLQYFSANPSISDGFSFGDKLGHHRTKPPSQPQPIFHLELTTQPYSPDSRPDLVHVLNNRKYQGNYYNWEELG